jgi:hypothetical protein
MAVCCAQQQQKTRHSQTALTLGLCHSRRFQLAFVRGMRCVHHSCMQALHGVNICALLVVRHGMHLYEATGDD